MTIHMPPLAWPSSSLVADCRRDGQTLQSAIRDNVDPSGAIQTDQLTSYKGVGKWFAGGHETVNHAKFEYARGDVSTNEAEAFFALFKRGITCSFHSVSKAHLHRYCNEFSFRWNTRKNSDADRTATALKLIGGDRLMYKDSIRKKAA